MVICHLLSEPAAPTTGGFHNSLNELTGCVHRDTEACDKPVPSVIHELLFGLELESLRFGNLVVLSSFFSFGCSYGRKLGLLISLAFSCSALSSSSCFFRRSVSRAGASNLSNRSASRLAALASNSSLFEKATSPNEAP